MNRVWFGIGMSAVQFDGVVRDILQRRPNLVWPDAKAFQWKPVSIEPDGAIAFLDLSST